MKINNNLNNKATLKEQAQNIYKSIGKFNILNDKKLLEQIQTEILNKASQGETELTFYLRKFPTNFRGAYGFSDPVIVVDLNQYPTTTFKEVLHDFVQWCVSKGFDKKDITYTLPNPEYTNEPLIYSITVDWSEKKKGTNIDE